MGNSSRSAISTPHKHRIAATYVKAEPAKLSANFAARLLKEPDVRFTLAPERSTSIAERLAPIDALKQKPGDWQGTLFPELHVENGN